MLQLLFFLKQSILILRLHILCLINFDPSPIDLVFQTGEFPGFWRKNKPPRSQAFDDEHWLTMARRGWEMDVESPYVLKKKHVMSLCTLI